MTEPAEKIEAACWRKIGVYGDGTCPELTRHVHCRNCAVYSGAGIRLLDRPLPAGHLREWTEHYAKEQRTGGEDLQKAFIFRIADEWFSLPPELFREVLEIRPVHSLPHRRKGEVLGLVNVRGELLICLSLAAILALEPAKKGNSAGQSRLLVVQREEYRFAFPVDEVHGVHAYDSGLLNPPPVTLASSTRSYSRGVLPWRAKAVGCLDPALIFEAFHRSLE